MLYGYPIAATADNWLHECLCEMVQTVHARLNAGQEVDGWPDIIPNAHRTRIHAYTSLRDSLVAYSKAAAKISAISRGKVLTCLNAQNQISDLLCCDRECESINALPKAIQKKIDSLFTCAFKMLTGLGIRDRHYRAIYDAEKSHVCPFCGCEYFDAPGAPREDLDHYLAKSIYPFAAANLQNLVPMGVKCNEKYKLSQDILRDKAGTRRRSFFPYNHGEINISLSNSQPFAEPNGQRPLWQIDFVPDSPECTTWDMVFKVRERYKRDVLDPMFSQWLGNFAQWFKAKNQIMTPSHEQVLAAIDEYTENLKLISQSGRDFLRVPMFQFIHTKCATGDNRLKDFMRDLVISENQVAASL